MAIGPAALTTERMSAGLFKLIVTKRARASTSHVNYCAQSNSL